MPPIEPTPSAPAAPDRRDPAFDLARTLILVSAIILHFDYLMPLSRLARPFVFFQFLVVSVGGFFFFTAGYMARTVYAARFAAHPGRTTVAISGKGIHLLLLYVAYVATMHLLTATPPPDGCLRFLFDHQFFAKVLIPFGLLYLLTPPLLGLHRLHPGLFVAAITAIAAVVVAYQPGWPWPERLRGLLFDKHIFFYPLLPAFITYAGGFAAATAEARWPRLRRPDWWLALLGLGLLLAHIAAIRLHHRYAELAIAYRWRAFFELATPWLIVLSLRGALRVKVLAHISTTAAVRCLGVRSLHYFLITNGLIGLLLLPPDAPMPWKLAILLTIAVLGHLVTWGAYRLGQRPAIRPATG
jgi:hypothetical protein